MSSFFFNITRPRILYLYKGYMGYLISLLQCSIVIAVWLANIPWAREQRASLAVRHFANHYRKVLLQLGNSFLHSFCFCTLIYSKDCSLSTRYTVECSWETTPWRCSWTQFSTKFQGMFTVNTPDEAAQMTVRVGIISKSPGWRKDFRR